ncbi:entericidin A/B family lipoprotein [Planctobacterium marinum]|nr:entericidin A/B family lipoprotein [Planctobacterium marinum]MCC2606967.1 entericidin A/B family lipoprotein [Planctobacterium marinum]
MKNTMKSMTKWLLMVCAISALSACATIEGIGKDVEKAGEAVQDAAND